jgi:hypothetical protein
MAAVIGTPAVHVLQHWHQQSLATGQYTNGFQRKALMIASNNKQSGQLVTRTAAV